MNPLRPLLGRFGPLCIVMLLAPALARLATSSTGPGDVDANGVVEARDLTVLTVRIFDATLPGAPGADANQDQLVGAADIAATIYALAGAAPPPTNTLRPWTPTSTTTAPPTVTATPTPTTTPTSTACGPRSIDPGTVAGSLTVDGCSAAGNGGRPSDVYRVGADPGDAGRAGQALSVQISADGFTPLVTVTDTGVYFQQATAPVEFLVTTARPYEITVGSTGPQMTGSYSLMVSVRNCPTPSPVVPTAAGTTIHATLLDNDCPDPFEPDKPAHRYTFAAQAGTPVQVEMVAALGSSAVLDPFLSLYAPASDGAITGYFMAAADGSGGPHDNFTTTAKLFFYPIETGTYTIVASGAGGTGPYGITFLLPSCTPTAATVSAKSTQFAGALSESSCPAPAPLPNPNAGFPPDFNTRAEVWTVTLDAGDVLGAKLTAVDVFDAQLYLLGPDHMLLAADNDGSEDGPPDAQLAYTASRSGTYTVIAASNDAAVTETGSIARYTLELQRCPARPLALDQPTAADFATGDCRGTGGAHMNSYQVDPTGIAGQFVTVTMTTAVFDSVLSLTDPSGVRVDNDDDPFLQTTDARVSRVVMQNAPSFITASSFAGNGEVEGNFTLWAQRCRTIPLSGSTASGQFLDDDCSLSGDSTGVGPKLNVFTFGTAASQMLSVVAPTAGCALAITPDGLQGPGRKCLTGYLAMPLATVGTTAIMVAAPDTAARNAYNFSISACPAQRLSYHSPHQPGTISETNCRDAAGIPADYYILRAPHGLATFSGGFSGQLVDVQFSSDAVIADSSGMGMLSNVFSTAVDSLWPLGSDLASAIVIRPASAGGSGTYAIEMAPAFRH